MRGRSRRAAWLAVAAVGLGLAGCGGPIGFYQSGPPRVPAGGSFTIEPGKEVVVYGVRSKRCGMTPPTFETSVAEMFSGEGSQAPEVGTFYDAGLGQRVSVPCGGSVPVRAIGYRAPESFEGEVSMVFYGSDQAVVTVALPPKPEPEAEEVVEEPEAAPEVAPEPEPEPQVEAAPAPAPEPAPEAVPLPEVEAAPLPEVESRPDATPESDVPDDTLRGRENF